MGQGSISKSFVKTSSFQSVQKTACAEYGIFSDFFTRVNFSHTSVFILEIALLGNIRKNQTFFSFTFKRIIIFGIDGKEFRFAETDDSFEKQKSLICEDDGNVFSFSRNQFASIGFLVDRNRKGNTVDSFENG